MPGMGPVDSGFLLIESREHPMHVGGLQLFTVPDGEPATWVRDQLTAIYPDRISPRFRLKPKDPVGLLGNFRWSVDSNLDLDHHIRRSAVPGPARLRELFELTSRWQGSLLDRHRPLWEVHTIEGLEDGRVAVFTKVHHALVDGVSALHLMQQSCSPDPDARDCLPPYALPEAHVEGTVASKSPGLGMPNPVTLLRNGLDFAGELASIGPNSLKVAYRSLRDTGLTTPFDAPRTILNGRIGGARRFVAQTFDLERFRAVASACDVSLNDCVLAVCGGALRRYMGELDELPDRSMTAMCPVNLRDEKSEVGGNEIGAMIATLGTDLEDPVERIEAVHESTTAAKRTMGELTPLQLLLMSGYNVAGLGLSMLPTYSMGGRPPFNVIISNVPGPRKPMYFNGAHLDGTYPASIPVDGMAMNITLVTYDGQVDFGITACRRSAPSVQRMIHHLEDSLAELEKATAA
ncbi:MAG TPA: wax ester/triacylglycerol synthase family O-acyltransferase [Flexivirga sp.]|uniref:WS/DGAT/MGAT family O-acyltransferase n=1 Tax=Flexivirga sp. TaxID=1962927 RepID=UPI002CE84A5C|nr:wax ester/triacylglycerol synthase family O-acyltransferase [Flexivirga sp.]HWC21579.1 wax ester/triacylglycerol synthase family O-acyltransferase [Flexivirga sp.]